MFRNADPETFSVTKITRLFILASALCLRTRTSGHLARRNAMKRMSTFVLALTLAASGTAMAAPQHHDDRDRHDDRGPSRDHRDDRNDHHHARGERLGDRRGEYVRDYRGHHLSAPPRGHQWRKVDNDYVLVAVATGIITSVIAAGR
jgi:Ni/Co efflux regulator RcnB